MFYLDTPIDSESLQLSVKNGLKVDVVVWIEERVK